MLAGAGLVLILYFIPERKPPKITRYHEMVDSAYSVLPTALTDSLRKLEKAVQKMDEQVNLYKNVWEEKDESGNLMQQFDEEITKEIVMSYKNIINL